ncbi:MAG: 30S ribosomal protein S11 [Firmicutes bacterium]|nr:30S ribosomal protein S11 [Bacillota bacterium]
MENKEVANAHAPAKTEGVKKPAGGAKKKKRATKNLGSGQVHIQSTFNNNLVTITDQGGNVISWCSSGVLKFRGSRKDTPFAAQQVAETAGKKAVDMGLKSVQVFVKGAGAGREAAIRALANVGLEVTSIKDVSSIPYNGCRPSKARRI